MRGVPGKFSQPLTDHASNGVSRYGGASLPPMSDEDQCMRGWEENGVNSPSLPAGFDYGELNPSPTFSTRGPTNPGAVGSLDLNSEFVELVEELKDHATIRNTHNRVKYIATRLLGIKPAIQDAIHRANIQADTPPNCIPPAARKALRQHGAAIAELLRALESPRRRQRTGPTTTTWVRWSGRSRIIGV